MIWAIVVAQGTRGVAAGFFVPASTAVVPDTVASPELLQRANALRVLVTAVAGIAGPALAGVLIVASSPGWAIAVDALLFLLVAIVVSQLRLPKGAAATEEPTLLVELVAGWRAFVARRWLASIVLRYALINFAVVAPVAVLGPVVALDSLGGAGGWALVGSSGAAGAVVGGLTALYWEPPKPLLVVALLPAAAVPLLVALAVPGSVPFVAAAAFVANGAITMENAVWQTSLQRLIPASFLSRIVAWDWTLSYGLQPVALLVAAPLAAVIGVAATFATGAVVLAGSSVALVAGSSVIRHYTLGEPADAARLDSDAAPRPGRIGARADSDP
jgi:hypothetical protein